MMGTRATRIKLVIEKSLLPTDKIVKLLNDYLLWDMISVEEFDTLSAMI